MLAGYLRSSITNLITFDEFRVMLIYLLSQELNHESDNIDDAGSYADPSLSQELNHKSDNIPLVEFSSLESLSQELNHESDNIRRRKVMS